MTRIIGRSGAGSTPSLLPREWRTREAEPDAPSTAARAAQILMHARQQARAIVQEAEAAALADRAQQRQMGWQQGYAEGRQQALRENAGIAQRLALVVADITADYVTTARNLDEQLAGLALQLARTIVRHEIAVAPETILHVARAAIHQLSLDQTVTIRVHADDAALLQAQLPALELPESVRVAVIVDPLVASGGCVVESGAGRIDATIDMQCVQLERLLHEQLDAASA